MNLSKIQLELIREQIDIDVYEWSFSIVNREVDNNFSVLRSLQNPSRYVDLRIKRICELEKDQQRKVLQAFTKRQLQYRFAKKKREGQSQNREVLNFDLSEEEQTLIALIENPRAYDEHSHDHNNYDIDKLMEYKNKKQECKKKITIKTLFSGLKRKIIDEIKDVDIQTNASGNWLKCEFNITDAIRMSTDFSADVCTFDRQYYYTYSHNLFFDGQYICLSISYPGAINFTPKWSIYDETDLDSSLSTILNCYHFSIPRLIEVVKNLVVD
jgi:hypothetical protein